MTHTPEITAAQGSGQNAPNAVFFSSGGITFAALMEMLRANQKAMEGMAEMAEKTTAVREDVATSVATATQSTYLDDAEQLTFQGAEQWTSLGASVAQGAAQGGQVYLTKDTANYQEQMGKLSAQVRDNNLLTSQSTLVGDVLTQTNPHCDEIANQIKNKEFDYTKVFGEGGLDKDLGNGVSLRDVLQSRQGGELGALRKAVGRADEMSVKRTLADQNDAQAKTQFVSMVAQGAGSGLTAIWKGHESTAMANKGAHSMAQQYAQTASQFSQETGRAQSDQSEQYNRNSQQVWQSLHEIVQVDTRG